MFGFFPGFGGFLGGGPSYLNDVTTWPALLVESSGHLPRNSRFGTNLVKPLKSSFSCQASHSIPKINFQFVSKHPGEFAIL
jgi:hypothetical protein